MTDTQQEKNYRWECPGCGAENTIAPAVVELCYEHIAVCDECDGRAEFDFSTRPRA